MWVRSTCHGRLLQALRRNRDRFPDDFAFQLNELEWANLRSQFVTSSAWGGRRYLPWAFTEFGALQVANVLKSGRATSNSGFSAECLAPR